MEKLSVTALRKQLYKVVDRVLETGEPVEVERRGQRVVITPASQSGSKLANLERRDGIVGNPAQLVDVKVGEWNEPKNLDGST